MLAMIPFIFAAQQLSEGIVWLALTNPAWREWQWLPVYAFLFTAQIIWPVWVPLSIALVEKSRTRRKRLYTITGIGSIVALYHAYLLSSFPAVASVTSYHIHYTVNAPFAQPMIIAILYIACILLPPFVSSMKRMKTLGWLSTASFIITAFFYKDDVVSVWCFFAALISWVIFLIMKELYQINKKRLRIDRFLASQRMENAYARTRQAVE